MQGRKTHDQELRIIEKRENTANAGAGFDAEGDLNRNAAAKRAYRDGDGLDTRQARVLKDDDRSITRGRNQESEHHKPSH